MQIPIGVDFLDMTYIVIRFVLTKSYVKIYDI